MYCSFFRLFIYDPGDGEMGLEGVEMSRTEWVKWSGVWVSLVMASMAWAQIEPEIVPIRDTGNPPDRNGLGAVRYEYFVGTYEVTNTDYAIFLNTVASLGDPYGLYHPGMADHKMGGIVRRGEGTERSPYSYQVKPGMARMPVNFVSVYDCIRYLNWMTNGYLTSGTEWGSYTITDGGPDSGMIGARLGSGPWVLPTEDEWYKAAYYDPRKGMRGGYWNYAVRGDELPGSGASATALAGGFVEVGTTFHLRTTTYGTYDQGGNAWEWTETKNGLGRVVRGIGWDRSREQSRVVLSSNHADAIVGFRVARISVISGEPISPFGMSSYENTIFDTPYGNGGFDLIGRTYGSIGGLTQIQRSVGSGTDYSEDLHRSTDNSNYIPSDGGDPETPPEHPKPPVPEPASAMMMGLGVWALLTRRR